MRFTTLYRKTNFQHLKYKASNSKCEKKNHCFSECEAETFTEIRKKRIQYLLDGLHQVLITWMKLLSSLKKFPWLFLLLEIKTLQCFPWLWEPCIKNMDIHHCNHCVEKFSSVILCCSSFLHCTISWEGMKIEVWHINAEFWHMLEEKSVWSKKVAMDESSALAGSCIYSTGINPWKCLGSIT